MAKEMISPAAKKRIGYIISDIAGTGAIISIVGLALAGVAVAAAYFLPAREVTKLRVETPYYAPKDAGFIKLEEKELPDLIEVAKTVPNARAIAKGLYASVLDSKTNPELLMECAQQVDAAVSAARQFDFDTAKVSLEAARLAWKKIAKGDESLMLLDRIIFAKQKILQAEAIAKIGRAETVIEMIGSSIDLELGRAPDDAAESLVKLSLLKKELTQLKDKTSTEDSILKGYFKSVLAKIDNLMIQLQEAK